MSLMPFGRKERTNKNQDHKINGTPALGQFKYINSLSHQPSCPRMQVATSLHSLMRLKQALRATVQAHWRRTDYLRD
jgi:hypothetical protein